MQRVHRSIQASAAALLLTVCLPLHGNGQPAQRILVFGDSLSDGGFYSDVLGLPPGSSFTTNPDPVAPEVFAAQLGLPLAVAYGQSGTNLAATNFATGGARVLAESGASIPIATQIDIFLSEGGRFNKKDLVYIQGGGNDFFAFAAGGGVDPGTLINAAEGLADQVARLQAAGAPRIVTMAVQSGGNEGLLVFNDRYERALAERQINALYFDTDALFNELAADPGAYGFTSVLDPACGGGISSLVCTPADWVSPGANETHILADSVHPAGKTQRIQGQAIASLVLAPEQIGQIAYAGQSLFRSHRDLTEPAMRRGLGQEVESTALFTRIGYQEFDAEGSAQVVGLEEDGLILSLGMDHRVHEETSFGIAFSLSDGEGDFDQARGHYNVDAISALFYAQGHARGLHLHAEAMLGRARYENLARELQVGPVLRKHEGDTDADFFSIGVSAAKDFPLGESFSLVPRVGAIYEDLEITGYGENNPRSTSARFSGQALESFRGLAALTLNGELSDSLQVYLEGQFHYEFDDDARKLTVLPHGAPVSYRSELYSAERAYATYDAGLEFQLSPGSRLQAGVSGSSRDELEHRTLFIGASIQF